MDQNKSLTQIRSFDNTYPWLEIECSRCKTKRDVNIAALCHPRTTFVHELASRLRCSKCARASSALNSNPQLKLTVQQGWTWKYPGAPSLCSTQVQPGSDREPDPKLLQAVVRAHAWLAKLRSERFSSIEELATAAKLHPKVVRQALRLAFLAPGVTSAILDREQPERLTLRTIPKLLSLAWTAHQELLD
jgi:hypothetical protein